MQSALLRILPQAIHLSPHSLPCPRTTSFPIPSFVFTVRRGFSQTQEQQRYRRERARDAHFFGFRVLKTEEELKTILQRLETQLGTRDIVAAFIRLSQFRTLPQKETIQFLTKKVIGRAPTMSAYDVTTVLTACVQLKCIDETLFKVLVRRLLNRECLFQMNGRVLGDCVTTVAALLDEPNVRWITTADQESTAVPLDMKVEISQELAHLFLMTGVAERVHTSAFVRIICGFGTLRFESPALQKVVCREVVKEHRLRSMRFDELVRTWKALAELQIQDSETLTIVSEEVSRTDRLNGYRAAELEILLTATKRLLPFRSWPFLQRLTQEATKPDRLNLYREGHLVSVIDALSVLRVRVDALISTLLEEVTKRKRLPFFTQQGMTSMLAALKTLGYGSHPRMQFLISQGEHIVHEDNLTDKQLLSFVFGQRKSEAEETVCDRMMERLLMPRGLSSLSDVALSGLLAGFHKRGISCRSKKDLCAAEVVKRLPTATSQVLSYYAYGIRVNKISSEDVLSAFASEVVKEERMKQFVPSQLAGIVYSLGMLGWQDSSTFNVLMTELCRPHSLNQLSEKGLANVITSVTYSTLELDTFVESIIAEATQTHRLLQSSEQGLLSLIGSFGRLRLQQRRFTVPVLEEMTKLGRLTRLTNWELADLIYNLSQMRVKTARIIENLKGEIMKPHRLSKMGPSEICPLVFGLGGIRLEDPEMTHAIIDHVTHSVDIGSMRNPQITNLIRGMGGLRFRDDTCMRKLMAEATRPERLEAFTDSEFASLMHGVGRLRTVDFSFVQQIADVCRDPTRLGTLSDQQLTNVFVSTTNLMPQDGSLQFPEALLTEVTKSRRLSGFKSYQLANIASVLEKESVRGPQEVFANGLAVEVAKPKRLKTMTQAELSILSRCLSLAGCKDRHVLKMISDELVERLLKAPERQKKVYSNE